MKKIGTKDELYPMHLTLQDIHAGIKTGKLLHGKFQAMRENATKGFVFISDSGDETDYVVVNGKKNINRAIHDDMVAVELLSEEEMKIISGDVKSLKENKPFGKIVGIIKRNWRAYSGILEQTRNENDRKQIFVPLEKRIPKIKIETRQAKQLLNKRIIVRIDSWPRNSAYPLGHYVEILGEIGDKKTETSAILVENDIPNQSFSQAVLDCLPSLPWLITEEDVKSRTDLRNLEICSIDPPGCTDIDDALHCRCLKNGKYEVGVHIADVSHFIKPSTAIDNEAALRGNTVYLVDKRIDMVPELLSSNLCSLRANEDRFAFSCIWEMDSEANILKTSYKKTIIRSKIAFTYEEAQCVIEDKKNTSSLAKSLRKLNNFAKILKQKRMDEGALTLSSNEIKFSLDEETQDPIATVDKQFRETNSLVEEFMLLANISVACFIVEAFPEFALLRRHPTPPTGNFEPLIKAGLAKGFTIEVDNGKKLSESLENCVLKDNPYFNTMMRMKATRCMTQALYFCSGTLPEKEYFHYGLAVPIYTHFTSPIRRYSDIIVHRLLATALEVATAYPTLINKKALQELCNNLNYRHKKAQDAGRSSVTLYMHLLLKDKIIEEDGYIFSVGENALMILLPKYGLETKLNLKMELNTSIFTYNEEEMSHTANGVTLSIFDPVTIQIHIDRSNIQHPYIQAQLVKPFIEGFSVPSIVEGGPPKKKRKTK
ncbi:exosome complex exonuclease RRP44 isoform X2 [Centruroides vittatus]|uniref:exosome complex exonuclease RRP44 isoform X2 n=1 Tax=Centruroides vittatus TaxID=120091 RepID=UPI00350FF7D0